MVAGHLEEQELGAVATRRRGQELGAESRVDTPTPTAQSGMKLGKKLEVSQIANQKATRNSTSQLASQQFS